MYYIMSKNEYITFFKPLIKWLRLYVHIKVSNLSKFCTFEHRFFKMKTLILRHI
jgi:hypothetical protein